MLDHQRRIAADDLDVHAGMVQVGDGFLDIRLRRIQEGDVAQEGQPGLILAAEGLRIELLLLGGDGDDVHAVLVQSVRALLDGIHVDFVNLLVAAVNQDLVADLDDLFQRTLGDQGVALGSFHNDAHAPAVVIKRNFIDFLVGFQLFRDVVLFAVFQDGMVN